jgi:uncharacterized protein YodC (DUF2158 family)
MLNSASLDPDDLVRCYAPPNLRSVMPGNRVMLRSGGPEMIVRETLPGDRARCDWTDSSGKRETADFALACLTCYGAR